MKKIIILILMINTLYANKDIDIGKLISPSFDTEVHIIKKQFQLTPKQIELIQKKANAKLDSPMIRFYKIKKANNIVGYAVLLIQTLRTKKSAILYIIDKNIAIKNIEIVAFNEPLKYKPKTAWQKNFQTKTQEDNLFIGKEIPTISGATLSAHVITDASRLALAIVDIYK